MDDTPHGKHDTKALRQTDARTVARHIARERQKRELRRERDRLVLDLADELGQPKLAELFGLPSGSIERVLDRARTRVGSGDPSRPAGLGSEGSEDITLRRGRSEGPARGDRWADADAHYEQLGRSLFKRPRAG